MDMLKSLTPTGRALSILGPLGLVLAFITGWQEVAVLALGCVAAVSISALWVSRPQPLEIKRTLHPPKVTVGESSIGIVEVRNATRRRVGPRNAEDTLGMRTVRMSLPALAPGEFFEQPYTVPAEHRGLFPVGPVKLTRSDPLRLFRREQGQGSVEQLWVRPKLYPMTTISSGWAKDLDGPTSDTAPRGSAAFHALREYQFGDDLRHVHWRTSARRSQLMVRHYVDTRKSEEVLLLDPRIDSYEDDAFEEAISLMGSIAFSSERAGRIVRCVIPSADSRANDERLPILDRLTLAQAGHGSLDDAFASVGRDYRRASAMVVVTGSANADELLHRARQVQRSGLVVVACIDPNAKGSVTKTPRGRVMRVPTAADALAPWAETVRQ
jgi:uncharacterized protein (DUF58 family)